MLVDSNGEFDGRANITNPHFRVWFIGFAKYIWEFLCLDSRDQWQSNGKQREANGPGL